MSGGLTSVTTNSPNSPFFSVLSSPKATTTPLTKSTSFGTLSPSKGTRIPDLLQHLTEFSAPDAMQTDQIPKPSTLPEWHRWQERSSTDSTSSSPSTSPKPGQMTFTSIPVTTVALVDPLSNLAPTPKPLVGSSSMPSLHRSNPIHTLTSLKRKETVEKRRGSSTETSPIKDSAIRISSNLLSTVDDSTDKLRVVVDPAKHQVKDFNILPCPAVHVTVDVGTADFIKVMLLCDAKMDIPDPIFIIALPAKHSLSPEGFVVFNNLRVSKEMLKGRTKGFQFCLAYTLIINSVEIQTVLSEPFYIWSNVNQRGFPREEREDYIRERALEKNKKLSVPRK